MIQAWHLIFPPYHTTPRLTTLPSNQSWLNVRHCIDLDRVLSQVYVRKAVSFLSSYDFSSFTQLKIFCLFFYSNPLSTDQFTDKNMVQISSIVTCHHYNHHFYCHLSWKQDVYVKFTSNCCRHITLCCQNLINVELISRFNNSFVGFFYIQL